MNKFTSLLLALLLLNGCSIEKRHYRKGYSVNWFTHKSTIKNVVRKVEPISTEPITASASNEIPILLKKETQEIIQPVVINQKKHHAKDKVKPGLITKDNPQKLPKQTEDARIVPTAAKVSFAFTLISILIFAFVPFISVLVALFGLIMGAIGLKKIKNHQDKYRGRGYAITGIAYGSLVIALFIALIIYFIYYTLTV